MSPDERQLLDSLFERIRKGGDAPRDPDAEALIGQAVRAQPYAPYLLSQAVIVQDRALQSAMARIAELEARNAELERHADTPHGSATSFLGGLFGGTSPSQPASEPQPRFAVGRDQTAQAPVTPASAAPWGAAPAAGPWGASPASTGGGFLRGALGTAAGVAGGMMLANSLGSLFGNAQGFGQQPEVIEENVVNNYYGADDPQTSVADTTDGAASMSDADFDDSGADFSSDSFDV